MLSIGFVLLTHTNQAQALRLTETLNRVFDDPPIACHHDFSQCLFETSKFSQNVQFVQPHLKTRWGTISLVYAMLRGLRLLYDKNPPDWFYVLSGADYPICDAAAIRRELSAGGYQAYMRIRRIDHTRVPPRSDVDTGGFESPSYERLAYTRYVGRSLPIPSWRHPHRGPAARHLHLLNPKLLRPFHPFSESFQCFAGDQWFAASRQAAEELLSPKYNSLLRYFSGRFPPDEAFCPTVLGNAPGLKITNRSRHFIRWRAGNHPRLLGCEDVEPMLESGCHFARKFAPDDPVLDLLDQYLGVAARTT